MTMTLTDGTAFSNAAIKHVDTFTYSRKYSSTLWMTTVLPVALNYSDWSANFEIANITGVIVKLNNKGDVASFTVSSSVLQAGSSTNPNLPYLIRAKVANANTSLVIKKTNCDVYPSTPKELVFTSGDHKFTFKGTYSKINSSAIYTSSKEVWSPASSIGPYRVYVSVVKHEPIPDPEPLPTPDPSTPDADSIAALSNRITALDLKLENKLALVWSTIGEINESQNQSIASTLEVISTALNNLNSRINILEQAIESLSPGSGSSNTQYESRISALENKLGNLSFEVTS